ncbi:MAG: protein-methionine-sulfoxide reductase catalytic subunit MsrP [Pseudomonadota bacterium]
MLIKSAPDIKSSEITPKSVYLSRRKLLAGAAGAALVAPTMAQSKPLTYKPWSGATPGELTDYDDVTSYNNFYEFGLDKSDPKKYAGELTVDPWSVRIDGLVEKPGDYALEDLMAPHTLEERIYRFRCVEAWAMVIPWIGVPLASILDRAGVQSGAKYVSFETLYRPDEMRGQRGAFQLLEWPYREGLRLDEAMHSLTIMATGLYGEVLPNQNGAPFRLVVPWKYGFKSIKSIVRISLTEEEPPTSWNVQAPREYGFYANVNPEVDHPRWSQARERVIGGGIFARKQPTLLFNGYADEVGSLYSDMDLVTHF